MVSRAWKDIGRQKINELHRSFLMFVHFERSWGYEEGWEERSCLLETHNVVLAAAGLVLIQDRHTLRMTLSRVLDPS